MSALKLDVLDMIREPDNYTSGERAQASEAIAELVESIDGYLLGRKWYNPLYANKQQYETFAAVEARLSAALYSIRGAA